MLLAAATLGKVRPQDDFYHSVNEDWIASHPIPADKSSVGIFDGIKVEVDSQIKSIFKDLLKLPKGESLAAELYASGMDSEALEKSGISPIKAFADQIMAPKVDLETVIYLFQRNGIPSGLFNIGAESNKLNTSQVVLSLDQPSLTLPEKSYYFEDEYQEIREHAQTAIENILNASDYPVTDYKSAAKLVFEFESRLANASMSTEELDHSYTVSNMVLLSDLKALTPNFNWDSFLNKIGVNVSVVSTGNSEYLKFLFQILQGTDQSTLKLYLYYSLVKFAAPYLNGEMVESNFAFEKIFSGKKSPSSREKLVAEAVSSSLPDEISKLYVKSHFAPEEKAAALEMVQYIIESYRERITNNDWMAAETKEKAILKLNNMNVKIGYPDQWIDYSSLNGKITRDQSYFQNILIASAFDFDRRMKTVGEDTPRWEWFMSAFTVNGIYQLII